MDNELDEMHEMTLMMDTSGDFCRPIGSKGALCRTINGGDHYLPLCFRLLLLYAIHQIGAGRVRFEHYRFRRACYNGTLVVRRVYLIYRNPLTV